jgi:hypothetical protein
MTLYIVYWDKWMNEFGLIIWIKNKNLYLNKWLYEYINKIWIFRLDRLFVLGWRIN